VVWEVFACFSPDSSPTRRLLVALINFKHRHSRPLELHLDLHHPNRHLLVTTSLSRSLIITTSRPDYPYGSIVYELPQATRHNAQQVCQDEQIMRRHSRSPQVTGYWKHLPFCAYEILQIRYYPAWRPEKYMNHYNVISHTKDHMSP
jgi:hypothetical protein